jgi:glucose/mannose-6-phosphate isomerase
MDKKRLEGIDTQKMYKIYDDWPNIAKLFYEKELKKVDFSSIDHVIFAGMGGSGALGDIFSAILSKTNIHVCVVKGYHLPKTVDSNTLVVVISISGNTDEALSILESANKQDCKLICFSSGGKIEQVCNKKNIEFRKIKQFHSPRASFPSFLYSILNVLSPIIPIKKEDIVESIQHLELLQKNISSENLSEKNPALLLAKWIKEIPLIYYPWGLQSAAIRFKNSLQENSKVHVIIEDIVESCHNGIVSWEKKSKVQPIFIRGIDDHIKTKEKYKILGEYFQKNHIEYKEIFSVSGNILSKIINLIYLLDYCSIYKAVLDEENPSPVKSIDFVKSKIDEIS